MSIIEDQVCAKLQERAGFGLAKYGVSLERTDLTTLDWLNHMQEELMDSCNYIQVLINRERIRTAPVILDEKTRQYLEENYRGKPAELTDEEDYTFGDERLDYGS